MVVKYFFLTGKLRSVLKETKFGDSLFFWKILYLFSGRYIGSENIKIVHIEKKKVINSSNSGGKNAMWREER